MVNRNLGTLLRCLVTENLRSWDNVLSTVEFSYNSLVNRTTGMSSFEIVTSYRHRAPIDLIPMSASHRPFESAFIFVSHIYSLHEEIKHRIVMSNELYKQLAELH